MPLVSPQPGAPALGEDTEGAIAAGLSAGVRGAARALVEEIRRATGLVSAPVLLTGGARAFLEQPTPFVDGPLEVVPELVHLGLLAAGGDHFARSGG